MEYRDLFLGIRGQVPEGWVVIAGENSLLYLHPYVPTTIIFSSWLEADSLMREVINQVQMLIGAPMNVRVFRGQHLEARGYLPGTQLQQIMRTPPGEYVIRVYPGKPSKGWASHTQYLSRELEEYAGMFESISPLKAKGVSVPDPVRGVMAFKTFVPPLAQVTCQAQGDVPVMEVRGKDYHVTMNPATSYVYGNPMLVQAYAAMGAQVHPYMDARSYAQSALGAMGLNVREVRPAPIPGSLFHIILAKLGSSLAMGQQPMFSSALVELDDGHAWVTTIGENFMGAQIWSAYVYLAKGREALWILQIIAAHFTITQEWMRALKRENDFVYKSALRSIRSTGRLRYRPMSYEPVSRQDHNLSYEDYSYDDYNQDEGVESEWEDVSTGTGMDTFYVDVDGQVRNMDLGEEVSFHEIDGEGVLRDEEGNEVGYVEDGYVYDREGNRLGWLDTSISDDWHMERLEQESSDPSSVFGYYDWGAQSNEDSTETPYYVSKDDEEDEDY